jgi:FKBP-type peptidyl-prolyl cis-trans isomerase
MAWQGLTVLPVIAVLLAPACVGAGQTGPTSCDHGTVTTDSGLEYEDLECGSGREAEKGDVLTVHYVGRLSDGTKFDSSRDRGEPLEFPLGAGQVIAGWDEGLQGMRAGGTRRLRIPPDLGYGESGVPDVIPPDATLTFLVELLKIEAPPER